jgi:ribosomal protein S18 acetylase RimI-like enzyme
VFSLRNASPADLAQLLPRTRALNDHEGIAISEAHLERALRGLLEEPGLGRVWLVERDGLAIGYAIVTFGYDLEFAGRDAWLTELWIDETARSGGAGAAALGLLEQELLPLDVKALHLQVRPENAAVRVYQRAGFTAVPRTIMSRRLV